MRAMRRPALHTILPLALVPAMLTLIQVLAAVSGPSPGELAARPRIEGTVTQVLDGSNIEVVIEGEPRPALRLPGRGAEG